MKQVDDTHFVTISLDEDKYDILNDLQTPDTVISSDNKKRKNLENFLGLNNCIKLGVQRKCFHFSSLFAIFPIP